MPNDYETYYIETQVRLPDRPLDPPDPGISDKELEELREQATVELLADGLEQEIIGEATVGHEAELMALWQAENREALGEKMYRLIDDQFEGYIEQWIAWNA